jgi:hypothetical protein
VPFSKSSWRQLREAMGEQTMEFRSTGCALVMLAYTLLFFSFLRWLHGDLLFLHKCANSFITAYEYCTNKPFINPQKVDQ